MDEAVSVDAVLESTSSESSSHFFSYLKSYSLGDCAGGVSDVIGRVSISMDASARMELDDTVVANPVVDVLKEDDSRLSPANGFTPDCEGICEADISDRDR